MAREMSQRDDVSRQAPRTFVDPHSGLTIAPGERSDFRIDFHRAGRMSVEEARSFQDLGGGEHLGRILARTGVNLLGSCLFRVNALSPDGAIAASGWACLAKVVQGSAMALNLSFGTHPRYRGLRLAPLLGTLAVSECLVQLAGKGAQGRYERPTLVNVQTREGNHAMRAVCARLGMVESADAAFDVPIAGSEPLRFVGYREPIEDFWYRVTPIARARLSAYEPGDLAPIPFDLSAWQAYAAIAQARQQPAAEVEEPDTEDELEATDRPRGG